MTENLKKKIDEYKKIGTGRYEDLSDTIREVFPFGRFLITVILTQDRKFVAIEEVKVNEDFRSYSQKVHKKVFHFIDEYEPEY